MMNADRERISVLLNRSGAIAAGVSEAGEVEEEAWNQYLDWTGRGDHAGMGYMTRHQQLRRDPRLLLEGARSIISLAFPFRPPYFREEKDGMIACYAYGSDYHDVLRKRLQEATEAVTREWGGMHRICIDSAPVMERYWAVKSGIGKRGRNGAVIVAGGGSMVLLAEILTTLELTPGLLFHDTGSSTDCDSCGKCLRRCPAGAIHADGTVDSRRCLSYLTIEHRGVWETPEAKEAMSTPEGANTIFGCDLCLRNCHLNDTLPSTNIRDLWPNPAVMRLTRDDVAIMTQQEFSALFKGSPIKRCKLSGLKRNIGLENE